MLLTNQPFKTRDLGWLLLASTAMVMSYASTMFMGVLLIALTIPHLMRAKTKSLKIYWLSLIGLFLLAIGVGTWSYLYPGIPSNKAQAMSLGILYIDKQIGFMALCATMLGVQFLLPWRSIRAALFIALLVIISLNLSEIFRPPSPEAAYSTRAYTGLMLFAFCCAIGWLKYGPFPRAFLNRRLRSFPTLYVILPVFMLFAECAFFDVQDSLAYHHYVDNFKNFVNRESGFIPLSTFRGQIEDDYLYGWCWTYPSMSLVLRHDTSKAIILATPACWTHQLFNPLTQLPDFSAYYAAAKN